MKTINHSGGIWLSKSREISSVILDIVAQEWVIASTTVTDDGLAVCLLYLAFLFDRCHPR